MGQGRGCMSEEEREGAITPPAYLQEDLRDLLEPRPPRTVVITHRQWMEPYHLLEAGELSMRLRATREHRDAFHLWLQALELYQAAFLDTGEWGSWVESFGEKDREAMTLRADLLGLAGSSSKPALDTILAGYYWPALGMLRSLLETCQRVGFVRRRGDAALQWFQPPTVSPIGPDGRPRPRRERLRSLPPHLIDEAFEGAPEEEKRLFDTVRAGIVHCHGGAHPSPEGLLQLYARDEPFNVFGPTYHRPFCAFALKWGLVAHLGLLLEIHLLRPQAEEWLGRIQFFRQGFTQWQHAFNAEFPLEQPGTEDAADPDPGRSK